MADTKSRRKWVIAAAVVVVVAAVIAVIVLTRGEPPGNGGNETSRPWVVKYGQSGTGVGGMIGIDPATSSAAVGWQTAESLHRKGEGTFKPIPWIASGWELAEDRSYVDYFIRNDVIFHNGDNVTAEDVKFSYERMMIEDLVGGQANLFDRFFGEVEIINDYQVRVYFDEWAPSIPTHTPQIVPKNYVEEVGWLEWADKPVTTGPFKIVDWERDVYVRFEKAFDDHWAYGPDYPEIDELIIYSIPESSTRLAKLKTGEVDIADIPSSMVPVVDSDPNLTRVEAPYSGCRFLMFHDMGHPEEPSPLHDPRVRKAVSLAIDRAGIAETVFHGTYEAWGNYWGPYTLGYERIEPDPYDPDEARRLLADAGYPDGFDTYFSYSQADDTESSAVISNLQAVGIRAEARTYEATTWITKLVFDQLPGMGWHIVPGFLDWYPDAQFKGEYLGWPGDQPEVNEVIEGMIDAADFEELEQAAKDAEALVIDEMGYKIPVWAVHGQYAYGPRIEHWEPYLCDEIFVYVDYKG